MPMPPPSPVPAVAPPSVRWTALTRPTYRAPLAQDCVEVSSSMNNAVSVRMCRQYSKITVSSTGPTPPSAPHTARFENYACVPKVCVGGAEAGAEASDNLRSYLNTSHDTIVTTGFESVVVVSTSLQCGKPKAGGTAWAARVVRV